MLVDRRPWLALGVAALAVAAAFASCSSDDPGTVADASTPDTATNLSPATCPGERPMEGTPCTLPEGTTCAFGACASYAVCTRGVWVAPPQPRPKNLCPPLVPEQGARCGACLEDGGSCVYGDPTCADAATNAAIAACRGGSFAVTFVTCVEAGLDANAEPDAPFDGPRVD